MDRLLNKSELWYVKFLFIFKKCDENVALRAGTWIFKLENELPWKFLWGTNLSDKTFVCGHPLIYKSSKFPSPKLKTDAFLCI